MDYFVLFYTILGTATFMALAVVELVDHTDQPRGVSAASKTSAYVWRLWSRGEGGGCGSEA